MYLIHPLIYIANTEKKGRGIFALNDIEDQTLIEISPVVELSAADTKLIHKTKLHDYYFSWGEDQKGSAIALGYLSIYNHEVDCNCSYEADFKHNSIKITTRRLIPAGTELTINYNMDEMSTKKLWF